MTRHAAGQESPYPGSANRAYAGLAGASLGPEARAAALRRMSQVQLDVLVVGGGVVGAGCALDAATRGLRVGLVETRDYAAGTSSRSSKLIHGGLRYLEQLNFRLVREALKERSLILTQLAPHLARPLPFMYPLHHRLWERLYVGAGVLLYDTMGGRRGLPGLEQANRLLDVPLSREDVVGVYAGLRPLLAGESEDTSRLSREHAVVVPVPGLVLVAGGKYTTYRVMAKDAVDAAVRDMPGRVADSCTDRIPLLGADGYLALWNGRHELARESGLQVARIEHLLQRYGSLTLDLLDLVAKRPALAEPIPGAASYLMVEACYGVLAEGALHLEDVLARRTRISIETDDRGIAASGPVAALMASLLGWDDTRTRQERDSYRARLDAERDSHEQVGAQPADPAPPRLVAPGAGPMP